MSNVATRFPQNSDTPTHQSFIGLVGGSSNVWQPADAALTRPGNTTAYANHNTIGSITAVIFKWSTFFRGKNSSAILTGARLVANGAAIATANMGAVRMHLFNAAPTAGNGVIDQGTWLTLFADENAKQGWADFSSWTIGGTGSDTIESYGTFSATPSPAIAAPADSALYAVLEATGAFTPISAQLIVPYLAGYLD